MNKKISAHKRSPVNAILTVKQIEQPSNNFIRIVFNCNKALAVDPMWIGPHMKLLFPLDGGDIVFPQTTEDNRIIWQDGIRERVRTYSIRDYNQDNNTLTIDFVIHEAGVATIWAQQAKIGDRIGLLGMGAKNRFDTNKTLILLGDVAAIPAICYTLEHLPEGQKATAIIESRSEQDKSLLTNYVGLSCLVAPHGSESQLTNQISQLNLSVSDDSHLFWGGMESSVVQSVRHFLKEQFSELSSDSIHLISYWREGYAEGQFKHHD